MRILPGAGRAGVLLLAATHLACSPTDPHDGHAASVLTVEQWVERELGEFAAQRLWERHPWAVPVALEPVNEGALDRWPAVRGEMEAALREAGFEAADMRQEIRNVFFRGTSSDALSCPCGPGLERAVDHALGEALVGVDAILRERSYLLLPAPLDGQPHPDAEESGWRHKGLFFRRVIIAKDGWSCVAMLDSGQVAEFEQAVHAIRELKKFHELACVAPHAEDEDGEE